MQTDIQYIKPNETLETLEASNKTPYWLYNYKGQVFYLFDELEEANKHLDGKPCSALNIFEDEQELDSYLEHLNIL